MLMLPLRRNDWDWDWLRGNVFFLFYLSQCFGYRNTPRSLRIVCIICTLIGNAISSTAVLVCLFWKASGLGLVFTTRPDCDRTTGRLCFCQFFQWILEVLLPRRTVHYFVRVIFLWTLFLTEAALLVLV
jgi:hypothetical protein